MVLFYLIGKFIYYIILLVIIKTQKVNIINLLTGRDEMTNLRQVLALNMRERRRILGLSQEKLAEKISTATTYITMIELGKKFPSVAMLERIALALMVDTTELFSVKPLPEDSLKNLHKSVLLDIEKIIAKRLKEL